MKYFNLGGYTFTFQYKDKVYRIKPGINENLPDKLEEPSENRLKKINDGQQEVIDYIQHNIPIINIEENQTEENQTEENQTNIIEEEKKKYELRMEYENKKNEILLSDKTDRSKKMALKKLEKEYQGKINE